MTRHHPRRRYDGAAAFAAGLGVLICLALAAALGWALAMGLSDSITLAP